MDGNTKQEIEAKIGTLRHTKAFINMLIRARKEDLAELRKRKPSGGGK